MAFASDDTSAVSKRLMSDTGVYVNYDDLVDFKFLHSLELQGGRKTLDFCMKLGLIADRYECPKCQKDMVLCERKELNDGFEWRCQQRTKEKTHFCRRSARSGSWFSQSLLDMNIILQIVWLWVWKSPSELIMAMTKCGTNAVSDWKKYCREVCIQLMMEESDAVGGPGTVVELEQSKFVKRKLNRGESSEAEWVIGGIERGTGKCFLKVVPDRSCASLMSVLGEYVLPETTVISDLWSSYGCLDDPDFLQLQVDQGLIIKDPDANSHTWSSVKRHLTSNNTKDSLIYSLAEYMWRKKVKKGNKFMHFIDAMVKVYPPLCRDNDHE